LTQTLAEYLASKRLLLVLDNAEHLLAACAQLADAVLRQCPQVVVLVSSREGLGIAGEAAYRVPSLSLPDPKRDVTPEGLARYEAVRLFVDRARAVRPSFQVDAANAPALASVCARLDGIPLALELAAARVRSLSVEEVNQRLDHRFRLLTGGSRTALPRQQTLRSLIDWSYDLLQANEQALLCRLAVFASGWTLAAAERVCSSADVGAETIWEILTSLADKSLVLAEDRAGTTRYRLLETVRQYARDRLLETGEGAVWRDRHLSCFVSLAEEAEPQLTGAEQQAWFDRLEAEHDNMRSALAWSAAVGGDAASGLRLAGALWWFWFVRGYLGEGRQWLSGLLAAAPAEPPARAKALAAAGGLARQQGDYAAAHALYEQCLALQRERDDRRGIAAGLSNLGLVAFHRGDTAAARAPLDEGLAMQRELGDRQGIAMSLNSMGMLTADHADYPAAQAAYEESLAIRRELRDRQGVAVALNNLGIVAAHQGDYAAARALYEEGLAMRRELGDRRGVALTLNNLGMVAYENGDTAAARTVFEESLVVFRELGDRRGIALSLTNLGGVAAVQGDPPTARALHEESLAIHREAGDGLGIASSLSNLGMVAAEQGDYGSARDLLAEGITLQRDIGDRLSLAESLSALARVAFVLSGPGAAARIWGGAERLREEINAPLAPRDRSGYERQVAAARIALGDDAGFDRAWQEGRAMTTDEVIMCALEERGA
jgi:predicted ATPase